jgi:hypothetical protein
MFRPRSLLIIASALMLAALAAAVAWHVAGPPSSRQGSSETRLVRAVGAEAQPAPSHHMSPEAVTRTYFTLLAEGRYRAARHYAYHPGRVLDGGWYWGDTIISIGRATSIPRDFWGSDYPSLSEFCHVVVRYHSTARDSRHTGDPPGDWEADANLGRKTPSSPWRMLSLGCPI